MCTSDHSGGISGKVASYFFLLSQWVTLGRCCVILRKLSRLQKACAVVVLRPTKYSVFIILPVFVDLNEVNALPVPGQPVKVFGYEYILDSRTGQNRILFRSPNRTEHSNILPILF